MVLGREAEARSARRWIFIFRAVGSIEDFKQQVTTSAVALGRSLLLLGGEGLGDISLSHSLQLLEIGKEGHMQPESALRAS